MTQLVALNSTQHSKIKVDTSKIDAQGAELHLVPTVINEFAKLVVHYPIVFTKNGDTGQFVCSAMMGLEAGENLFWQQRKWQGIYVPLQVSRQPFFLGKKDEHSDDFVICLDLDNDSLGDMGERLFNEQGRPTQYLQDQQSKLEQLLYGEQMTHELISKLQAWDLLTPLSLDIMFVDQSSRKVTGLYSVDEDKLAQLDADKLYELYQQNLLAPIYTLIASLGQIYALIDKKNQRIEAGQKWFQTAEEISV